MKDPWTRNGKGPTAAAAPLDVSAAATLAEVDHVLTVIRSVHSELANRTSDGLELRVLATLQVHSRSGRGTVGWQKMQRTYARGWAPAAVAAALLCVFTGGIFVARETSLASGTQQEVLAGSPMHLGVGPVSGSPLVRVAGAGTDAATGTKNLAIASARTKPAAPISAGRIRGRGTSMGAPNSR